MLPMGLRKQTQSKRYTPIRSSEFESVRVTWPCWRNFSTADAARIMAAIHSLAPDAWRPYVEGCHVTPKTMQKTCLGCKWRAGREGLHREMMQGQGCARYERRSGCRYCVTKSFGCTACAYAIWNFLWSKLVRARQAEYRSCPLALQPYFVCSTASGQQADKRAR